MNIEIGLAVDKENPEDNEVQRWSNACSYYPKEFKELGENGKLEPKLRGSQNIAFLQADLLSTKISHMLPVADFDAVILSTILYQCTSEERELMLKVAMRAAKPTGLVIVQDFAVKNPGNSRELIFNGAWGGGEFGYRTFVLQNKPDTDVLEIFQWSDGRCRTVKPGEDFDILLQVDKLDRINSI